VRPFRRLAPVLAAITVLLAPPCEAASRTVAENTAERTAQEDTEPYGASCRIKTDGSETVAHCHNPYVPVDHVRLHVECDRWWDIDTDSAPVEVGPAMTVRLEGRCWKEIRSVWVSHER